MREDKWLQLVRHIMDASSAPHWLKHWRDGEEYAVMVFTSRAYTSPEWFPLLTEYAGKRDDEMPWAESVARGFRAADLLAIMQPERPVEIVELTDMIGLQGTAPAAVQSFKTAFRGKSGWWIHGFCQLV